MANKSWFSNLNPFNRINPEVKELQTRLDAVVGEKYDAAAYETKFLDAEPSALGGGMGDFSSVDQQVDIAALQKLYCSETWVYVAVSAISKTIAGLPLKLEKKRLVKKTVKDDFTGEDRTTTQEVWEDASGEKLAKRFQYPNPETTRTEFVSLITIDLMTAGEFFIYLDSDVDLENLAEGQTDEDPNSGFNRLRQAMTADTPIKAMYRIPPSLMKPMFKKEKAEIDCYMMQSDRGVYVYMPAEIIHVKLPNPLNPLHGLSPLLAAFKPVLLDRFSTEHMIRFYKSGARLGGVIETDKSLNKEQLSRFQRSFESSYTGRHNHHRTLILPPGMSYKQVEQNPAETALLEFVRHNREAVLAAYNVPPIKVGIMDKANYANALVQLKIFFNDTIKPILSFIEEGFNLKNTLMPGDSLYRVKFDLAQEESLKENFKEKAEAAKFMIDAGLSINEVRKRVWEAPPVEDGDKIKTLEDIKNGKSSGGAFPLPIAASATPGAEKTDPVQGLLSGLPGPMVTTIMNILGRVTRGRIDKNAACEMMAGLGVPRELAQKLLGIEVEEKSEAPKVDLSLTSDIKPTNAKFEERVAQLTEQFMKEGLPLLTALQRAMEQAKTEGFDEDPTDPSGGGAPKPEQDAEAPAGDGKDGAGDAVSHPELRPVAIGQCNCEDEEDCQCEKPKKTLEEFLTESLAKLDDSEGITPDLINEIIAAYKREYSETVDAKESELADARQQADVGTAHGQGTIQDSPQLYAFGLTKDDVVDHWKSFISKTDPLVDKRKSELDRFFNAMKSVVLNRLGANLKAYGLHKARDNEDVDDILDVDAFDALIKAEISKIDKALVEAYSEGYQTTLTEFKFSEPNETAVAWLKKNAADKVKGLPGVVDTTRDQLREVISDSFEKGEAIGEVSKAITEKFEEIKAGRAQTIARTETLSAVSAGREQKRQDWQQEFPDRKLKKMWVSAQDDRVRDSHRDLDGMVVDADAEFKDGLRYPRDEQGDANEVINCRCTDMTFDAEDEESVTDTAPKLSEEQWAEADAAAPDNGPTRAELLSDDGKHYCAAGIHSKGGAGSGCHGPNCGRKPGDSHAHDPSQPRSHSKISEGTKKLIERRAKGKGEPVELNRSQMVEVLENGTYALVSAGRNMKDPSDSKLTDKQVEERYNKLEGDLKKSGYAYTRVAGHYGGKEDSFLVQVHEADREDMVKIGKKYKQDSVIYTSEKHNEMIYTTGENAGKAQVGHGYSWQDKADDFYTEVTHPDGKISKFQLNFDFDTPPKNFTPDDFKGGPGSGCHGDNCGRHPGSHEETYVVGQRQRISEGGAHSGPPTHADADRSVYDRPKVTQLAPRDLAGGKQNNFKDNPVAGADPDLMDTKGKDVGTREVNKFQRIARTELETNALPAMNKFVDDLKSEGVNVVSMKARAKDADSLQRKMQEKWPDKSLNQVTDGIGGRIVVTNMREVDKAVAKANRLSGMTIIEHKDHAEDPNDTGYRATHLLMRTKGGMIMELQIKTENQNTWSKWSHDDIYKNPALKGNPEVDAYAHAVSDHLYALDRGQKVSGDLPVAPKAIKDAGLTFPWGKVNNTPMKRQ